MSPGNVVRFVAVFLITYVLLRFTLGVLLQSPTAAIVSVLTGCPSEGNVVVCGYDAYVIIPECTGIVSIALFIALAYVLSIRSWRSILFGIFFLYILDILRLFSLISLGVPFFGYSVAHAFFWLLSPVLVVLYVWWLLK